MNEETYIERTYGPFRGGDPRDFEPDVELCTAEEIKAWGAACAEWAAGRGVDRGPGCQTFGDGSVVTGTGFGIGVNTWHLTREEYEFMYGDQS